MAATRRKRQGKVRVRGRKLVQRIAWPTSASAVKALAVERRLWRGLRSFKSHHLGPLPPNPDFLRDRDRIAATRSSLAAAHLAFPIKLGVFNNERMTASGSIGPFARRSRNSFYLRKADLHPYARELPLRVPKRKLRAANFANFGPNRRGFEIGLGLAYVPQVVPFGNRRANGSSGRRSAFVR